jgi:uncharacterized protein YdcH (DUF465 family)
VTALTFDAGVLWYGQKPRFTSVTGEEGTAMNAPETQEVKNLLLREHEQYRELAERHHELDDRLHELTERHFLSDTEQFEETTLKKKKLALKDQMEMIVRDYAASHA